MIEKFIAVVALLSLGMNCGGVAAGESDTPFPGERSEWNGYAKYDFKVDGRDCCVVEPSAPAPGKPWIWRARFWGHEPQTDVALLGEGFHVVYMDVVNLFGNAEAVAHWNAFYSYLTEEHGFAPRPALEGMSRGGLIVYNWAAANPERVACIYADAPVCDIKSWPGGLGKGTGNAEMWPLCLKAYGLTEEAVGDFTGNPIDHLAPLAAAGVPLLHVYGDADVDVPPGENTQVLAERYRALDGPIQLIGKEGVGHHPHSLQDPQPIVRFILRNTCGRDPFIKLRSPLLNSLVRFQKGKKGRVAFLGGSITEMEGWREMVCRALENRFPETDFDFVNAGVGSTDSTLGAFRLARDVFGQGRVDLLFVEYAVNDHHNGRTEVERVRGMEGIVRQARTINPEIDVVIQYLAEPDKMDAIRRGETPPEIASHERVAACYKIPVVDEASSVTERIDAGEFTWKDFRDLHPSPFGHRVYARAIDRLFDSAWNVALEANAATAPHPPLPDPLDPLNYERGRLVDIKEARLTKGWQYVESWTPSDGAATRKQFTHVPMLVAEIEGAELHLRFSGTAVGILVVAGPDVGVLEYSVDKVPPKRIDPFTKWSHGLHIPWAYMLETDLAPGDHELVLRTTEQKNADSLGHACRIVRFLVN